MTVTNSVAELLHNTSIAIRVYARSSLLVELEALGKQLAEEGYAPSVSALVNSALKVALEHPERLKDDIRERSYPAAP